MDFHHHYVRKSTWPRRIRWFHSPISNARNMRSTEALALLDHHLPCRGDSEAM
jgi:hypothetical protein